jgi:hypothetical protein
MIKVHERTVKAVIEHTCARCGERIAIGERYLRLTYVGGGFKTVCICIECE